MGSRGTRKPPQSNFGRVSEVGSGDFGLQEGRGFLTALRHTFETIGGESRDQVAVDHIMGHARDDMASRYRERISDERLKAVTETIHRWLFGESD